MQPLVLGAIIALGGVLVANLVQIWLKLRERTLARTDAIRSDVYNLSKESLTYTTVLYQRGNDGISFEGNSNMREHLNFLTGQLNTSYHEAIAATFTLMACGEPRISGCAQTVHHALTNLHQKWAPVITSIDHLDLASLDSERLLAQESTDVLLNMVEPRWYEKNLAFRSETSGKRMLEKVRSRHAETAAAK